jgi:hypothetical protein
LARKARADPAKEVLGVDKLEAVADRGYFSGEEILACDKAGIAVTLPKPMTSGAKSEGRFGKQETPLSHRRRGFDEATDALGCAAGCNEFDPLNRIIRNDTPMGEADRRRVAGPS